MDELVHDAPCNSLAHKLAAPIQAIIQTIIHYLFHVPSTFRPYLRLEFILERKQRKFQQQGKKTFPFIIVDQRAFRSALNN